MTLTAINFKRTFHYCILGTLIGATVYCLFVIVPFFAFGLHLQPSNLVRGGMFDPKNYPMYGGALSIVTFSVMLLGPLWHIVFGGVLALTLKRYWPSFPQQERLIGSLAVIISISMIVFMFSPLGRLIMIWWAD